ncbi:MAG: hypothetical protein ACU0BB_02015 [Paracoccaceae bacterium]|jgi:hypothetical protein
MTRFLLIAGLCLSFAAVPVAGQAQSLSRMLAKTGLAPEDFLSMGAAARSLYDRANPSVGSTNSWANKNTGSNGTVKLESLSGGCAVLLHTLRAASKPEPQPIRTKHCKGADGTWHLSN